MELMPMSLDTDMNAVCLQLLKEHYAKTCSAMWRQQAYSTARQVAAAFFTNTSRSPCAHASAASVSKAMMGAVGRLPGAASQAASMSQSAAFKAWRSEQVRLSLYWLSPALLISEPAQARCMAGFAASASSMAQAAPRVAEATRSDRAGGSISSSGGQGGGPGGRGGGRGERSAGDETLELSLLTREAFLSKPSPIAQEVKEAMYQHRWDKLLVDCRRYVTLKPGYGRQEHYTAMVAVGNMRGLFGLGKADADTSPEAVSGAYMDAFNHLAAIPLYRGHTIYNHIKHEYSNMTVSARAAFSVRLCCTVTMGGEEEGDGLHRLSCQALGC
ncbi:hypothetical protein QJQ45_005560 [Haematococcus lacustris]|nr:hypothetical protein QJQ45_005560 [Haematococcus lacustris]